MLLISIVFCITLVLVVGFMHWSQQKTITKLTDEFMRLMTKEDRLEQAKHKRVEEAKESEFERFKEEQRIQAERLEILESQVAEADDQYMRSDESSRLEALPGFD